MLSFFQKRDPFGNGLAVWVLATLLFALPFIFTILKDVEMKNEVEAWLPERDRQAVLLSWYSDNFTTQDRLFISWDGSSLDDPRAELLAAKLEGYVDEKGVKRRGSPYVSDVLTPTESLAEIQEQGIDPENAVESLTGLLIGRGAMKVELTDLGREKQTQIEQEIIEKAKEELGVEVRILPQAKTWEPPLEFESVADIRQTVEVDPLEDEYEDEEEPYSIEVPEHDFQLTWHLIKPDTTLSEAMSELLKTITSHPSQEHPDGEPLIAESFFTPGTAIGLVATLNDAGQADRAAAIADVRQIAAECFIPEESVHLGGRPVGSAELNSEVSKATYDAEAPFYLKSVIGFSSLTSCLLAFFMLRSFRLGTLVLIVSAYATLLTVMLVPLTGSSLNMVLIVMPTLLSVLTLSGAIHLASYWKHAARENSKNAIAKAVRMAAQPCFLASATTAIGLASLVTSTLTPVRDFGIYAAIGCGISLIFVLFVLPALMQLWPGQPGQESEKSNRNWNWLADFIIGNSTLVTLFCLGLFGFGLYGLKFFKTETKVVRYFPEGAQILTDYWYLEDNVLGINTVDTIIRFDDTAQSDLKFLERLEIVRKVTEEIRAHEQITGAISLSEFQEPTEKPGEDAKWLQTVTYNKRSNEFKSRIEEGTLPGANSFITIAKIDANWDEEGTEVLSRAGDELWRISAQAYVMADNDYGELMDELDGISQSVLKFHPGASHVVTGMVPVFLRTQEALLESLIRSFGMAFGVIAIVMILVLGNPIAGLITMLPNLLPVAFCFGMLSFIGQRVDIGTMITASVALGIAVDGTLHLLTWYKQGILGGKTRQQSIELALSHCAPAMWQTSAIVALGLLMLAPATLLMISRFGILMAALVGTALIADIVFLPALLAGPLGRIIENSLRKRIPAKAGDLLPDEFAPESPDAGETSHVDSAANPKTDADTTEENSSSDNNAAAEKKENAPSSNGRSEKHSTHQGEQSASKPHHINPSVNVESNRS